VTRGDFIWGVVVGRKRKVKKGWDFLGGLLAGAAVSFRLIVRGFCFYFPVEDAGMLWKALLIGGTHYATRIYISFGERS
jgi:hypothetical protein